MKMPKIVVIDTETGGLDANEHSILSLAAVVWNHGGIEGKFAVTIREPQMKTTLEALKVNGFTREVLEIEGVSPATAVSAFHNFLQSHDIRTRATIAAHNAAFDIPFVKRLYRLAGLSDKEYSQRISHRTLCTQTLAIALQLAGRGDYTGTSLDVLCKYYGIVIRTAARHDALEDAVATAKLLTKQIELLRRDPFQEVTEVGDHVEA